MLDRVGYIPARNLQGIKIIEPASGDGAFAEEIIARLFLSAEKFGFSFQDSLSNLVFFELDAEIAQVLKERIESKLSVYKAYPPSGMIRREDFLLAKVGKCDIVIGNPPYVRHENIPDEQKEAYRRIFSTFTHRSDLYIAFYEKSLSLLLQNGVLSFICSNRWLKNQYGKSLRRFISLSFALEEIIDLEDASPFEEDVIAYPAITTIKRAEASSKTLYYKLANVRDLANLGESASLVKALSTVNADNWFALNTRNLPYSKFLDTVENQGFKIGIGVATGLDKVFIRKDFAQIVEEGLLLPIVLAKDLKNNKLSWSGHCILNPFAQDGQLINLNEYPRAAEYFAANEEALKKRHVARKTPHLWYKTIDRINPALTKQPKILLPDISSNNHLLIDAGHYYPHHNLYYIIGRGFDDLAILAALLMSDFVKGQLLEMGNKMNGGYPRWQAQNLKKLRIPIIDAMPNEVYKAVLSAYHKQDYTAMNKLITAERISQFEFSKGQMKLFEPEPEAYKVPNGHK